MEGDHCSGEDAVNEAFGVGDDGQGLQVFFPECVPGVGAARVLDEGGGEHRGGKREDAAEESGAEGVDEGVGRQVAAQQRGKLALMATGMAAVRPMRCSSSPGAAVVLSRASRVRTGMAPQKRWMAMGCRRGSWRRAR